MTIYIEGTDDYDDDGCSKEGEALGPMINQQSKACGEDEDELADHSIV